MPFQTYDDGNRLEDTLQAIMNLSPTDRPFMNLIGKTRCSNTLHQWPEDTLAARADNAVIEGADFSYGTVTAPSRLLNVTQIVQKLYDVSSTTRWVKGAGVDDMKVYQKAKAMAEIANDLEVALLRGSLATGNASVARRMAGALNWATTSATAVASGTKLTESFFNGQLELSWLNGGDPTTVLVPARLKRVISSFIYKMTANIDANAKKLLSVVESIDTDFGSVKIIKSRDMLSGAVANSMLVMPDGCFKMAVGEAIHELPAEEVAQSSHSTKGVLRGEQTLECLKEKALAKTTGLSNDF